MSEIKNPRETLYQNTKIKNWSTSLIKSGLNVDSKTYRAIYVAVGQCLSDAGILNGCLKSYDNKHRLQTAIKSLYNQLPEVFRDVPEPWREKAVIAIARKYKFNAKRSQSSARNSPGDESTLKVVAQPLATPEHQSEQDLNPEPKVQTQAKCRRFGTTLIRVVHMDNPQERLILYRPCELVLKPKSLPDLSADDLSFEQFKTLLQEDLGFTKDDGIIYYDSKCESDQLVQTPIANERCWRAALEEMFARRLEKFYFSIQSRSKGSFI